MRRSFPGRRVLVSTLTFPELNLTLRKQPLNLLGVVVW